MGVEIPAEEQEKLWICKGRCYETVQALLEANLAKLGGPRRREVANSKHQRLCASAGMQTYAEGGIIRGVIQHCVRQAEPHCEELALSSCAWVGGGDFRHRVSWKKLGWHM